MWGMEQKCIFPFRHTAKKMKIDHFSGPFLQSKVRVPFCIDISFILSFNFEKNGKKWNGKWLNNDWIMGQKCQLWMTLITTSSWSCRCQWALVLPLWALSLSNSDKKKIANLHANSPRLPACIFSRARSLTRLALFHSAVTRHGPSAIQNAEMSRQSRQFGHVTASSWSYRNLNFGKPVTHHAVYRIWMQFLVFVHL